MEFGSFMEFPPVGDGESAAFDQALAEVEAAEQYGLAHALWKEVVLTLWHDADEAGELLARQTRCRDTNHVGTTHERR